MTLFYKEPKTRAPRIRHSLQVLELAATVAADCSRTLVAAVLHDILTTTKTSLDELYTFLSTDTVGAIVEVTTPLGLKQEDKVARLSKGSWTAKVVKVADIVVSSAEILFYDCGRSPEQVKAFFENAKELVESADLNRTADSLASDFELIYNMGKACGFDYTKGEFKKVRTTSGVYLLGGPYED